MRWRDHHPFLFHWAQNFIGACAVILILKLIGVPLP